MRVSAIFQENQTEQFSNELTMLVSNCTCVQGEDASVVVVAAMVENPMSVCFDSVVFCVGIEKFGVFLALNQSRILSHSRFNREAMKTREPHIVSA